RRQPAARTAPLTPRTDLPNMAAAQPLFQSIQNDTAYTQWTNSQSPQLAYPVPVGTTTPTPLQLQAMSHDINRNPYFRYQPLQKIGNVLTTRSNCFAVWVTIGYFEVEDYRPNAQNPVVVIDAAHPDGLALGPELGADSGEI